MELNSTQKIIQTPHLIASFFFFQALEDKERKASSHRENLMREQRYLRRRLELLSTQVDAIHKRRSVSECSTSTVSSSHSSASESGKTICKQTADIKLSTADIKLSVLVSADSAGSFIGNKLSKQVIFPV